MAKHFQVDTGGTLTTSLVSYWNEDSDSNDYFGSNNGTESSVTHPGGKVGNAVLINGTSAHVQYGSNFSLAITGASFAFWINIPSSRSGQVDLITDQSGSATSELYTDGSNRI